MAYDFFKHIENENIDISRTVTLSDEVTYSGASATAVTWTAAYYANGGGSFGGADDSMRHLFVSCGVNPGAANYSNMLDPNGSNSWYPSSSYILVGSIDTGLISDKMHGPSIKIELPTGRTGSKTYYGALFAGPPSQLGQISKGEKYSRERGGPMIYLFDNDETPYSGTVHGGSFLSNPNSAFTGWENHQYAVSWVLGMSGGDSPAGFVMVDRGLVCMINSNSRINSDTQGMRTSFGVTNNCVKQVGDSATFIPNTSGSNMTDMCWTGTADGSRSGISFKNKTISFKKTYFCHLAPNEFNYSTNLTWDRDTANNDIDSALPVYITEVGLYNDNNVLIAMAKLSEPVKKDRFESMTFRVQLVL